MVANIALFTWFFTSLLPILLSIHVFAAGLPVLPNAQGFGIMTPAGRGGVVLFVTNLNANGPGSLRHAISTRRPRIIVFEVAGTIEVAKNLVIDSPYITIAGQTAPSPGITIKGAGLAIRTHDVLVEHIHIRVGDNDEGPAFGNRDALYIEDVPRQNDVFNILISHCSLSWGVDENLSLWYPTVHDVTIQDCIISEALNCPKHPKGPHSKGIIVGPGIGNISFIRNLIAHNKQRNPYLREGTSVLFINNLVYNYGDVCMNFDGSSNAPPISASIVGNVFVPGPDSTKIRPLFIRSAPIGSKFYVFDNRGPYATKDQRSIFDIRTPYEVITSTPPIWTTPLTVLPSDRVIGVILSSAGARPGDRGDVDERIIAEVQSGQGHIISSQEEVGGWPKLLPALTVLTLPCRPKADDDHDGYTNIEEWLFSMARKVERPKTSSDLPVK